MTRQSSILVVLAFLFPACAADDGDADLGAAEQDTTIASYSATLTSNATVASQTAMIPIAFGAGETIMIGTQGITGSSFVGDTFLRLRSPSGADLAVSDDVCGTRGSRLSFTSPNAVTDTIWGGCFSDG